MQQVLLTVDLGFGDAGKGSIVDFLTRVYAAHTVVRYNGGAQAGHRVVTAGLAPQEHIFAQFGSGTLAGAATHLSRFMLLDPLAMVEEEKHLRMLGVIDAFQRTTIDAQAVVITPFQRAINRLKELARGDQRHGSCGMGIGETVADQLEHGERVVLAGDLAKPDVLRSKLSFLRSINLAKVPIALPDNEQVAQEMDVFVDAGWVDWLVDRYGDLARQMQIVPGDFLNSLLRKPGSVVFESAQGVLLDEWLGFHPYTTWSTTTLQNADRLLSDAGYRGRVARIGLTRGYATRHGPGPFVSEDAALTSALPDPSNGFGAWQRGFRVGWLDLVLLRYALEVVGRLDYLAVTCLDRLAELEELKICCAYQSDSGRIKRLVPSSIPQALDYQEKLTRTLARCRPLFEQVSDVESMLSRVASELGVPVGLISEGPTAAEKRFLLQT